MEVGDEFGFAAVLVGSFLGRERGAAGFLALSALGDAVGFALGEVGVLLGSGELSAGVGVVERSGGRLAPPAVAVFHGSPLWSMVPARPRAPGRGYVRLVG
ncbi:MAG: hypothetical protein ACLQIB_15860 [Isosphaeraceae bacterium]